MRLHPSIFPAIAVCAALLVGVGCGSKDVLVPTVDGHVEPPPTSRTELCNTRDDDLDGAIDEPFRDSEGHYVDDAHCGGCGRPCAPSNVPVLEAHCRLLDGAPSCVAVRCAPGFVVTLAGRCAPAFTRLCLPCTNDDDCGDVVGARCITLGGEPRCGEPCTGGNADAGISGACPAGYACDPTEALCLPAGGSCSCDAGENFDIACALVDPDDRVCAGDARCDDGVLSTCTPPVEACNELDDDCDAKIDESYRDVRGAYSLDIHHCGMCGVDCTANPIPAGSLVCGGDPLSPSCVLDCVDARDGVQPGDRVDGDRDIATGCECTVRAATDEAGPVGAIGEALDVNCDGADGVVVDSIYVATDGADDAIGSPTRPMKTLTLAIERASASLATSAPRAHVFVATGTYTEVVTMPSGVKLHGGYRRDFLALDPTGFVSEVRAPSNGEVGGYALTLREPIVADTVVEWFRFVGADAIVPSGAAIGAFFPNPNEFVTLRECEIRAGVPGAGIDGTRGSTGASPSSAPVEGAPPRGAVEDAGHACLASAANVVAGGAGGANACAGVLVSGGAGASPSCPFFASFAPNGSAGRPAGARPGGTGGSGGQDSQAPITGSACPNASVCCGLADFSVPSDFATPGPGANGSGGLAGTSGRGCLDAFGGFLATFWTPGTSTSGTSGSPGSGGGGGGAGGGTQFNFVAGLCPYADGLGGGGGGGGAGGCGGAPGTAASSGGPSVALLIDFGTTSPSGLPNIVGTRFISNDGGRGGDGGAGGGGGTGGTGAVGQEIPRASRTTPTLAGPFAGGRGGRGGDGGAGGAGGGGCGGPAVGVWVYGLGTSEPPTATLWRANNLFNVGQGGVAGRGGGAVGSAGASGGASHVLFR